MALLRKASASISVSNAFASDLNKRCFKSETVSPISTSSGCDNGWSEGGFWLGCKTLKQSCSRKAKRVGNFTLCSVASAASIQSENQAQHANGPNQPSPAELARTLLEVCNEGTLSSIGSDNWPIATSVKFSVDADGLPIFLLFSDSLHAVHILHDNRCSLHVNMALPGEKKPQCTLKGKIISADDDALELKAKLAWKKRFGEDETVNGNQHENKKDFFIMEVDQILTWNNFGEKEEIVSAGEYSEAKPDPLRNCAFKIVEDMNREHFDDIKRFCYAYANIDDEVEDASLTWVDHIGFDMRVIMKETKEVKDVRIKFPREVMDDRDARSSIMMMAQISWEKERNYIPPEIPLLGNKVVS